MWFSEASLPEAGIKKKVKGHTLFPSLNFLLTHRKTWLGSFLPSVCRGFMCMDEGTFWSLLIFSSSSVLKIGPSQRYLILLMLWPWKPHPLPGNCAAESSTQSTPTPSPKSVQHPNPSRELSPMAALIASSTAASDNPGLNPPLSLPCPPRWFIHWTQLWTHPSIKWKTTIRTTSDHLLDHKHWPF